MPAEFDKMVDALKKQLKKQHPDWEDEKINSSAYAIATQNWKKMHGGKMPSENLKLDEKGRIIVSENMKLILNANIVPKGEIINEN